MNPEPDVDPPYPAARVSWLAVVVLCLLYVMSMLDRNVITLMASEIKADLRISDFELSLLYGAAFSIFYAVSAVPIGWAIDSMPRRRVIFVCVSIWSLATTSCGLAVNYATMFMGRAFVGAGEAVLTPAASSVLADIFPPEKLGLPMSIYFLGARVGQSLSLLIAGGLTLVIAPAALFSFLGMAIKGWQLIFVVVGLPGLFAAAAIFLIPEPARRHSTSTQPDSSGYRQYLRYVGCHKRLFFTSHLGTLLYLAITTAIVSWSPAFLQRDFGLSPQASGGLLGLTLLIGPVIGSPLHGWFVDGQFQRGVRDAHLRHMVVTGWISLPIGVGAFLVGSPTLAAVLIGLYICVIAGYSALPTATILLCTPGQLRGKASSVLFMINGVMGITIGPSSVAFLTDYVFHDPAKVGLALACVLGLFIPIATIAFAASLRSVREALEDLNSTRG